MCSQANLHQLLSEVLAHAQDCFGSNLDGVILYGSHARGDADEESDVDIMILVRQPAEQLARQRREWSRFGTGLDLKYEVFTSLKLQDAARQALSQYRLSKAEECYIAAKCLLDDGLYTDSANRSYYAIFHAVRALLALEGVDFKKHSGVISHFQQHYIKTGMFDREYSDVVRDAFSIRQNCDYEDFFIPSEVYDNFKNTFIKRGKIAYESWKNDFKNYAKNHKKEALRFENLINNDVSAYLSDVMPDVEVGSQISTRNASGKALNDYILSIPNLIGGSADVAGSVITKINGGTDFTPSNRHGHNINWGIREFLMASAANGIMLHHGLRVYVGCFLVFADYMKSAIRMAALSHLPVIYLFSHDSIAVGEDGPTHQPIEQLAMLRSIPNLNVIRPCDEKETYAAWYLALKSLNRPTAIILSRQNLLNLEKTCLDGVKKGAYTILDNKENDIELIATGSEVSLALDVANSLLEHNIKAKVVSMPCFELFEDQDKQYQDEILSLPYEKRFSIEMLSTFGWAKYAKHNIGIDSFGTSAPANDAIKYFKFTKEDIVNKILKLLNK